jgi:hypothetical protein
MKLKFRDWHVFIFVFTSKQLDITETNTKLVLQRNFFIVSALVSALIIFVRAMEKEKSKVLDKLFSVESFVTFSLELLKCKHQNQNAIIQKDESISK